MEEFLKMGDIANIDKEDLTKPVKAIEVDYWEYVHISLVFSFRGFSALQISRTFRSLLVHKVKILNSEVV